MAFELVTIPCLNDNYAFLLHNRDDKTTLLVDVPEAAPISHVLDSRGWTLTHVLLTHHHWDHVDGLPELLKRHSAQIIGAQADAHRLPALDIPVSEGCELIIGSSKAQVFDVSGHTINHIAVYIFDAKVLFTADSLMALGCGRLFEGTPDQMWESLNKLMSLPADTIVCSGHEYTSSNARFALSVDPTNIALIARSQDIDAKRAANQATVPSQLGLELETNPFLRAKDPAIRAQLNMQSATDAQVFAEIRKRKDNF